MAQIFTYATHENGTIDDTAFELTIAAKAIDPTAEIIGVVTGSGSELESVCEQMTNACDTVYKIDHEQLAFPNAEAVRAALLSVIPAGSMVLLPHNSFGMDLGPGLSIKMDAGFVSDAIGFDGIDGAILKAIRSEFEGQVNVEIACDLSTGAVITVRSGQFAVEEQPTGEGTVVDKSGEIGELACGRRYKETITAEIEGEVDITKSEILVAVGRGIEDEDNLELAEELAENMGGDICCSRPLVDAKWLGEPYQVGTSGRMVKPKVYMALGINGSFQHMGGVKGKPLIIAVNKNPKAPIFQMADIGVVDDILEFMPALSEKFTE